MINLAETDVPLALMPPYRVDISDEDWIICEISDGRFIGHGDPSKLLTILEAFTDLLPTPAPT